MKCLVAVKRVIDYNVKIRIKSDQSGVETDHVKMSMNPFDEIAIEEAVRLKEAGIVDEIIAVTIGTKECQEILRLALARGVDRAILMESDETFEPLNIAKILKAIIEQEKPDLVILGKQAIDDDANQTGQMLAALLKWPQGTYASKLSIHSNNTRIEVTREVDRGLEIIDLELPAIITTDLRLNEPRYISLPNVMRAKNKPIENRLVSELGLHLNPHTQVLKVEPPMMRRGGVKLESVKELVDKLKNEAKVI